MKEVKDTIKSTVGKGESRFSDCNSCGYERKAHWFESNY